MKNTTVAKNLSYFWHKDFFTIHFCSYKNKNKSQHKQYDRSEETKMNVRRYKFIKKTY